MIYMIKIRLQIDRVVSETFKMILIDIRNVHRMCTTLINVHSRFEWDSSIFNYLYLFRFYICTSYTGAEYVQ